MIILRRLTWQVTLLIVWSINVSIAGNVDLVVEGVYGGVRDNVLGSLSINREINHPSLTDERIKRLHARAEREIADALKPFGFYKTKIKASAEKIEKNWKILYLVDPGSPVVIEQTNFDIIGEGATMSEFNNLKKSAPFNSGNVLNHKVYEDTKSALQQLAVELGYFDAKFIKNEIQIDLTKYSAVIYLVFDTGIRYQFGHVHFEQSEFNEKFLRNFLQINPGDPYSLRKMIEIRNIYSDSDHFQLIDVALMEKQKQGRQIPVQIKLIPKKRSKYNAGVGYGTDSGPRVSLGFERRRINRNGHKYSIGLNSTGFFTDQKLTQFLADRKLISINSNYTIPLKKPRTDQLVFILGWEKQEIEENSSEDKITLPTGNVSDEKIFFSINHSFLNRGWLKTTFLRFEFSEFFAGFNTPSRSSELIIPGSNWTLVKADDRIYTRRGNKLKLELKGSLEYLLSSVSFLQVEVGDKFVQKMGNSGRLLARFDAAYTHVANEQDFSRLPVSLRYFSGGDQSVRGYSYNSLFEDLDGQRGARHLVVGSLEYEYSFYEKWALAVFYDVGNAINRRQELEKMRNGVGIGLRYKSPVGMIRLDLAFGLDKTEVEKDPDARLWQVHINVGPDL